MQVSQPQVREKEKERETQTPEMAIPAAISAKNLSIVLLLVIFTIISGPLANAGDHHQLGWLPSGSDCTGSIAECLAGDEFSMDSEINRRILATSQYISYQALRRNSVPCSRRGASYYNCRPGAQANPYRRGCSAITRCRN